MRTYKVGHWARALFVLLIELCLTPSARAWTETQITSVAARVDARDPRVRVELTLGLQVREGWLSSFELLDLGPELALGEPPELSFLGADGAQYPASVQITPGNGLSVTFADKRSSPRRGDYSLRLAWSERLPEASGAEQRWSLPRWPERVANVRVVVLAARGARPSTTRARSHDGVEQRDAPELRASVLTFVRAELPRTARFEVAWSLPAATSSASEPPRAPARWRALGQRPVAWWLGACLALLWLLKWSVSLHEPGAASADRRQQLPGIQPGMRLRTWASALGCGLAVGLFEVMPLLGAGLGVASSWLALDLAAARRSLAAVSGTPPLTPGYAFLDAARPAGAVTALLVLAALCWLRPLAPLSVACCACLAATLFLGYAAPAGNAASAAQPRRRPEGARVQGRARS